MRDIYQALADHGAELRDDDWVDGMQYVTIPVGDAEAVEVEYDENRRFQVMARRWDRTHALDDETYLSTEPVPGMAIEAVKAVLARIDAEHSALEALLDAANEEGI